MMGSIACGECQSVDTLHCGTDGDVEELGGARVGDLGDELMLHALEGDARLGKQAIHRRVDQRFGGDHLGKTGGSQASVTSSGSPVRRSRRIRTMCNTSPVNPT